MNKQMILYIMLIAIGCLSYTYFSSNKKDTDNLKASFDFIPISITDSIYSDLNDHFTKEKAALGRYFFYDTKFSINNSKSCASCHAPQFSFADDYNRSIGALGDLHQRNTRPLINILFDKYLTSSDSSLHFPEQQMNNPMFNTHPIELGTDKNVLVNKIKADDFYSREMKKVFSNEADPFTIKNIQYCISSFVRSIVSLNSPYDKFINGDKNALNETEQEGMQLFFSDRLQCNSCHGGINFSTPKNKDTYYFNTGIYNVDSSGSYPAYDQGLIIQTKQPADMGAYRVPTLRNLGFTAPYYHDGSARTIDEVIDAYARGGRNVSAGIYKGDGMLNPHKSHLIKGFQLTSQQRKALISFLFSLTDSTITSNPAFADPFKR